MNRGPAVAPAQALWRRSLRLRLLLAIWAALGVALVLAGFGLSALFREHVQAQFAQSLTAQLDQLTARLATDPAGEPRIDDAAPGDPRWQRPLSGLYWQLDRSGAVAEPAIQRSRSLWDASLQAPPDALADGEVHRHEVAGPAGTRLLLVERTVSTADGDAGRWRLMVAGNLAETAAARARFDGLLAASIGVLALLLAAAATVQVSVGLAPLRALRTALARLEAGDAARLDGPVPAEVEPLVEAFNRVLDRNDEIVARARAQAGNLAHAVKTPLAALAQVAAAARRADADAADLAERVDEQVALARRQVDWHLSRARAAAASARPGQQTAVREVVEGLLRVMARVHAARALAFDATGIAAPLRFAGESQDLHEMLGNLLDNACHWARGRVVLRGQRRLVDGRPWIELAVEDDGPGIAPARREEVLRRGARLDESVPGSGLGLAIVDELARLYGGRLRLEDAPAGGLRAVLELPAR